VRILVTNDDGITATGLKVLARALRDAGHDVFVVAPFEEASGAAAGVGPLHLMGGAIGVEPVAVAGLEDLEVLGADALPALIVLVACLGAFGDAPDLVCAGINPGRNVGRSVLHSGTVGAALTAVHFGLKGLATSIQSGPMSGFESEAAGTIHFETAAALAVEVAAALEEAPARTVMNLNVPNLPLTTVLGLRSARLAHGGLVRRAEIESSLARASVRATGADGAESGGHDRGKGPGGGSGGPRPMRVRLELGLGHLLDGDESDEALTSLGWAVLTPLSSVTEDMGEAVQELAGRIAREALGLARSRS